MVPARIFQSFRRTGSLSGLDVGLGCTRPSLYVRHARMTRWLSTAPRMREAEQGGMKQSLSEYNGLRRPWLRVFLGAFFTYQVLYWCWEKMRTDEAVEQMNGEVKELEQELEQYQKAKAA